MRKNFQQGFTLIESLVAITILVLAIIGATSTVQSGISSYIFSKDQIIAFYLAQEGAEEIRNIRDENRINNRNWLTGLASVPADPCYFGHACIVSPVGGTEPTRCSAPGSCPVLRQDQSWGFYGYNASWVATTFKREIKLASINENEVSITVTISWSKGPVTREFTARENILNWQ